MTTTPRVVYVLSKFPCYDETFLLREIDAVSREIDTWIFSLRRSRETVVHEEARALLPRIVPASPFSIACANASLLRRRPRAYFAALFHTLSGNRKSPEFLLKNALLFPRAILLAHWALENRVTHLHAGWATYPASAALVASEITGIPFSLAAHAHDIYLDTTHLAEKLKRAAFTATCTTGNRDHLRRLCPDARVLVVHHGVRVEAFAPAARSQAPIEVLSVGTLNPHKGFEPLIDALELLAEAGLDFRATIVGGGPLERALRERLVRRGVEGRVEMTGALEQSRVIAHFARASIFVLMAQPEWHWGIPNVIVEALAARCAVVTTRFGSVEELIRDGETGLLVPPRDPAALAAAVRRLSEDRALRDRLADRGHEIVSREFELRRCVSAYVSRFRGP